MAIITISLPAGKGSPGLLIWFQGRPLRLGQKVGPEVESWGEKLQTWEAQWEAFTFRNVAMAKGLSAQRFAEIFEVTLTQAERWLDAPNEIKGTLRQFCELGEASAIFLPDLKFLFEYPNSPEPQIEPAPDRLNDSP